MSTNLSLVLSLVLVPMIAGVGLLCFRSEIWRRIVVALTTLAVAAGVVMLAILPQIRLEAIPVNPHWIKMGMTFVDAVIALYVLYIGIRARRLLIVGLMLSQALLMGWFEWTQGSHIEAVQDLFVDKFSIIMALINGLVGGGICLYALGYMREYHAGAHAGVRDRRPLFFSLLFVFMGAMFGIVFANNLLWLLFFWELTTLCSFLLIGYTGTPEAQNNALRALVMNLSGGLAFAAAIVWFYSRSGSVELQTLVASKDAFILFPVALLCFAGITKSAQLPFSSWLLGAMVAPTPVSALLHSSTMVKAGAYLVLRLAPALCGTAVGMTVALVGATTFVIGSLAATTASDAKRVLAWSTVANLGLIVLCGGIGTYEAVWAGLLLLIFHAVAKCLLFLCVGLVEHKVHSRDIEAMSGLIVRMPRVAVMMLIGMAGMFLAPFGMLISKWAVLKAVVDASPLLSVFVVFGGSATLFFWVKWMGKLLETTTPQERSTKELVLGQAIGLYGLSALTLLACLLFPFISSRLIEPYVAGIYGHSGSLGRGNILIMTIMMTMVLLFPLSFVYYGRGVKVVDPYLGGANAGTGFRFVGSAGQEQAASMGNYYLRGVFSERWLSRCGVAACALLLAAMVVISML